MCTIFSNEITQFDIDFLPLKRLAVL